jgi:hypothetical protein
MMTTDLVESILSMDPAIFFVYNLLSSSKILQLFAIDVAKGSTCIEETYYNLP